MRKLLALLSSLALLAFAQPTWAAWSFGAIGATSTAANTNVTPLNVAYPSGINPGDIILHVSESGAGVTHTWGDTPTSLCASDTSLHIEVFATIATGSESGTVTMSNSNTSSTSAFMIRYTGGPGTLTGIVHACQNTGGGASLGLSWPALTITHNNTLVIGVGAKGCAWTSTAVGSEFTTERLDTTIGGIKSIVLDDSIQTTATSLSGGSFTITGDCSASRRVLGLSLEAGTGPQFSVAPAIGTRTTSSVPVTATTACTDCNYYGVAVVAASGIPTCTQVKAGNNSGGTAAYKAFGPIAMTTTVQNTGTFSTYTDGTVRDGYFCLNSTGSGDSVVSSIASMYKLPAFSAGPTFSSTSTGGATYTETLDGAGTIYGVACKAGSTGATVAQVESGQCTGGTAAQAAANTSGGSLVIGTVLTLPIYDFDIVGTYGSQHEAAIHAGNNRVLTAPSTCGFSGAAACQYITIASIGTGSPCESFNTATNPDIAASDILKAPASTHPGSYGLAIGTDCQFSYSGDTSRQDALNIGVYDYSAQGFHADDIDFWANNLPPVPPDPDSLKFSWQVGTPITPIDLKPYCPDPESDAVTVTSVSGLAGGMSIVASTLSGTPTTPGITTLTLECTDITGAFVDWH